MGLADRLDGDVVNALSRLSRGESRTQAAAAMGRMAAQAVPKDRHGQARGEQVQAAADAKPSAGLHEHFARMESAKCARLSITASKVTFRCDVVSGGYRIRCTRGPDLLRTIRQGLRDGCSCTRDKRCMVSVDGAKPVLVIITRCSRGRRASLDAIAAAWPALLGSKAHVGMGGNRRAKSASRKASDPARQKGGKRRGHSGQRRLRPIDLVVTPVDRRLPADRILKLSRKVAPVKALDPLRQFGRGYWHDTRTSEE